MNEASIGFFDSGVGGLTIWKEVVGLLPMEPTVYLADSLNAPYGEKNPDEILELSRKNTIKLLEFGCKLIVVACNTATTNAIAQLRQEFEVPFIGIEPAIKPAALHSVSKKIGVLATRGTLTSSLFAARSKDYAEDLEIIEQEGEGLVRLIESGDLGGEAMSSRLQKLLQPMLAKGVDHLVLGCTHYPFLIPTLQTILPESVTIVDCGLPVARQVKNVLTQRHALREASGAPLHRLFSNADVTVMNVLLNQMGQAGMAKKMDF
ncbi:MAG: hypothetical protein RLZZ241_69 [Bacteroidota bacterium]|jgi:glutamate racemase